MSDTPPACPPPDAAACGDRGQAPPPYPLGAIFTLDIAGLAAAIETPDALWAAPLVERYAAFLSQAAPAWRVVIAHAPGLTVAEPPWIRHEGPLTRFRLFRLAGVIDLAAHTATVEAPDQRWAASALERTLTYILMQVLPRQHDGLLIHGAGIVLDGLGYLFAGPSGAGKTTVAGLAAGVGQVLSDENVVVRLTDTRAELCSTPFWGQSTPPERVRRVNRRVPLAGIYMLVHAPDFSLTRLRPAEAVAALLNTEKVATERVESADAWLAVAGRLAAAVPVYRLGFRPTAELWSFLARPTLND